MFEGGLKCSQVIWTASERFKKADFAWDWRAIAWVGALLKCMVFKLDEAKQNMAWFVVKLVHIFTFPLFSLQILFGFPVKADFGLW